MLAVLSDELKKTLSKVRDGTYLLHKQVRRKGGGGLPAPQAGEEGEGGYLLHKQVMRGGLNGFWGQGGGEVGCPALSRRDPFLPPRPPHTPSPSTAPLPPPPHTLPLNCPPSSPPAPQGHTLSLNCPPSFPPAPQGHTLPPQGHTLSLNCPLCSPLPPRVTPSPSTGPLPPPPAPQGHTLILNWNRYTVPLLKQLGLGSLYSQDDFFKRPVVLLSNKPKAEVDMVRGGGVQGGEEVRGHGGGGGKMGGDGHA